MLSRYAAASGGKPLSAAKLGSLCTLVRSSATHSGVSQWQGCDPGWALLACTLAESLLSCPPLCDRVDCSPLGPSVHGISQARVLEWVAISSSRGSS